MAALKAPPSQDFLQKTLGAQLLTGVTASATLNHTTGVQNLPGVFVVDRINTACVETPSSRDVVGFTGTSGSTVTTLSRGLAGTSDQDHAVGAIVEFAPDVVWAQSIYDALSTVVTVADTSVVNTTNVVTPTASQTLSNKIYGGSAPSLTILNPRVYGGTFASLPVFSDQARMIKGQLSPWVDISDATNMWVNFAEGNKFRATVVGSGTRNFLATNATIGSVAMLRIKYASAVSFALNIFVTSATISWPSNTVPTFNMSLSRVDVFGFTCNATIPKFDAFIIGQGLRD